VTRAKACYEDFFSSSAWRWPRRFKERTSGEAEVFATDDAGSPERFHMPSSRRGKPEATS
jgi:hypothetical protein